MNYYFIFTYHNDEDNTYHAELSVIKSGNNLLSIIDKHKEIKHPTTGKVATLKSVDIADSKSEAINTISSWSSVWKKNGRSFYDNTI